MARRLRGSENGQFQRRFRTYSTILDNQPNSLGNARASPNMYCPAAAIAKTVAVAAAVLMPIRNPSWDEASASAERCLNTLRTARSQERWTIC